MTAHRSHESTALRRDGAKVLRSSCFALRLRAFAPLPERVVAATLLAIVQFASAQSHDHTAARPAANDWCTTGWDCTMFAIGDIDNDGLGDVLTINGNRDLCVAFNVHNWKAAPWEVLAGGVPTEAVGLFADDSQVGSPGDEVIVVMPDHVVVHSDYRDGRLQRHDRIDFPAPATFAFDHALHKAIFSETGGPRHWILDGSAFELIDLTSHSARFSGQPRDIDPPPFEPHAALFTSLRGDVNGDDVLDSIGVFTATRPHNHNVVRIALEPNQQSTDQDSDGAKDDEENKIGSNPLDSDTDDDGLIDGWELHGLPRGIPVPDGGPLSPLRQDVIIAVSRYEPLEAAAVEQQVQRAARVYTALPNHNIDGTTGVSVHCIFTPAVPVDKQHGGSWTAVGNEQLAAEHRGFMHWMQVTPGGGGQAQQTGDMGGSGCHWAAFAHEVGHQLSLSHEGDSAPAWCPLYPSIMNYAFNYALGGNGDAVAFSDGKFASVSLDESRLIERLPFSYESLRYLEAGPFRFTLKADGESNTLIDWNQNGRFDEGEVSADINYGGSTNGGVRRNHDLIGAAPVLCYVGDACYLITIDQQMAVISIKNYLGDEKWSERRSIPASAADSEPVALGLDDHGLVFFRRNDGWRVSRFTAEVIAEPVHLPDLPKCDLSVARVNGRVLLVSRYDDDRLEARWLDWNDKPTITTPWALELKSQVPVAMIQNPADKRLLMVTSVPNSRGRQMCMRVTWFAPPTLPAPPTPPATNDRLTQQETLWTRGEASGNNCTTRPVISITDDGQLFIFHTGWPDGNGQMIAYRTRRIGNQSLDEGWLTCMMYDIWTRTRVGVAFANGKQGAIYAYRWDSGEYGETHVNHLQTAHNGLGIDTQPMRDHDDSAKISLWGIRHSILNMRRD
jgi:hypothetical protein